MSEADSNNNAQVHAEEQVRGTNSRTKEWLTHLVAILINQDNLFQNGSPSKHNKNAPSEEVHNAEEEPHSESGNVPRVEPNLFTVKKAKKIIKNCNYLQLT